MELFVIDRSGLNDSFIINLTVLETQHPPNITNPISSENNLSIFDSFSFDFNASDLEDYNETEGLLNFSLVSSDGATFLIVNSSDGTVTNSSSLLAGIWNFSIFVRDSSGLNDSHNFTLRIYGYPEIIYPMMDMSSIVFMRTRQIT